jgi:hypothetical protein
LDQSYWFEAYEKPLSPTVKRDRNSPNVMSPLSPRIRSNSNSDPRIRKNSSGSRVRNDKEIIDTFVSLHVLSIKIKVVTKAGLTVLLNFVPISKSNIFLISKYLQKK